MSQLNIQMTPVFERSLRQLVRVRRLPSKSDAVRMAVEEALQRAVRRERTTDFRTWLGLGLTERAAAGRPLRFTSHAQLWE